MAVMARWIRTLTLLLLLLRGTHPGSLSGASLEAKTPKPGSRKARQAADDAAAAAVFTGPIQRFTITFVPAELNKLRDNPRSPVSCSVSVGTQRFEKVLIHVKGSAGSTRSVDDNPALTLNFDKLVPGQRFNGLDKIHLNNSVQDPSLLSEQLGRRLYEQVGIPTARATQALVTFDGRDLGPYVLKEGYNRSFLRRHYPDPTGNFYDGGFIRDIDQDLDRDSGDGPLDYKDLQKLRDAASLGDLRRRETALMAILDVDRFITECAMQALLVDWDGYGHNRNNYRIYFEPRAGKAVFQPHGMDQLLGNIGKDLELPGGGLLARQLFDVPAFRDRFYAEIDRLLKGVFTTEVLDAHFKQVGARLNPMIQALPQDQREWRSEAIHAFQDRAFRRIEIAKARLESQPKPIRFEVGGVTALARWQPRYQRGQVKIEATKLDGVDTLYIQAQAPDSVASFRAMIRLPIGKYEVRGRLRTRGVRPAPDQRYPGGAAFRLSGGDHVRLFTGDTEWTEFVHPFQIHDPRDIEMVAEIRAHAGEAWFDLKSLQLKMVP
jgi:spore coat protein H